ncbi:amylo-alpha-1,6-glucosidase [Brevibacillus dissolubilis]|uniref:amylo-alpha-1,6-glucosidase n=1 Tax=Brevibacillus dissolubilis TaxID=1844116 RepID=UPI0011168EEE|nr:amylo-alpha-1,6-glucosidase [Brevibacillus dissolubilis]
MDYRVIKEDDLFLLTDKQGDIPAADEYGLGLYSKDTRFLSRFELLIHDVKPVLLSSSAEENDLATIRLTNPPIEGRLWRESVEIKRQRLIYEGGLYETITLTNFYPKAVTLELSVRFDADFLDMFIVRGFMKGRTGEKTATVADEEGNRLIFGYIGADGVKRETRITWDVPHSGIEEGGTVRFSFTLAPKESQAIRFFIAPYVDDRGPVQYPMETAVQALEASYEEWLGQSAQVESDMPLFDKLYQRGVQDLRVLLTDLGYGRFPVAGLPWYAVPFGRDSLIAALQMLSSNREVARGTLLTMAQYQGTKQDEWRDEQPGKIMHEIRFGELAGSNQVPFTPYYGTIDATPLFLILLIEYYHWSGDLALVGQLLPHVERALDWIKQWGDRDGDEFVEYHRESAKGIANQGWKDSDDSVVHENGDYAISPIALVEVQGYVYQAKLQLVPILRQLGRIELADRLEQEAEALRQRFEADFWMEDEEFYAIALDHEKKQVRSVTSNPGHALMSGIMSDERAAKVAKRLVAPDLFSGYGIRTMSTESSGYNPMSYHDGSVWPHDNSLCMLGLAKLGFGDEAGTVISGLLQAARGFEYYRLPELFCGYDDSLGAPVAYPVACSPQAWAAGTPLVFLQVMLGITPDAVSRTIRFHPVLPDGMNELTARNLQVGEGCLSVHVLREAQKPDVFTLEVLENTTGYGIQME